MEEHHLQLNLAKTERVVFPTTPTLHDFTIQLGSSTITPSSSVRNLGVIFNVQLTFKDHIAKTARSYRFALHNIRKIRCYSAWLASKLAWPEPYRESMGYCQEEEERHQTQQFRWAEGWYQSNLDFITPEQCHRLIVSMPRHIAAIIHAKGGPTKYWVHRDEHTFREAWHSCLKCPFCIDLM